MSNQTSPAKPSLDFGQILEALEHASAFDLYRLENIIRNELSSPARMMRVKRSLTIGQQLSYFDCTSNSVRPCEVLKLKQKKATIRDLSDGKTWNVDFCMLNLDGADSKIHHEVDRGLSRHTLSTGDVVGFRDKRGIEHHGKVVRLNDKTVTLHCRHPRDEQWRVAYSMLYRVLEGEAGSDAGDLMLSGDASPSATNASMKTIEGTVVE